MLFYDSLAKPYLDQRWPKSCSMGSFYDFLCRKPRGSWNPAGISSLSLPT